MEIVKTEKYTDDELKAYDALESSSKPFLLALIGGNKISELDKIQAGTEIYNIIKVAEFDSGFTKLHDDDLLVLAKSTYDLIIDRYPNLTIQEFKVACKSGVLDVYGDWKGMCLKTIAFWINSYLNTEGRIKAIKEWNAKLENKTSNIPVAAILEFNKQGALRAFQTYKSTGRLPIGAFAYYDLINEMIGSDYKGIKTLVPDPEEREKICKEVLQIKINIALEEKKIAERKGNYRNAENLIEAIMNGFKGNMEKERKTAFLKSFFDSLIKQNKPLQL